MKMNIERKVFKDAVTKATNLPEGMCLLTSVSTHTDLDAFKKRVKRFCDNIYGNGAYEALQIIEVTEDIGFQWYYKITGNTIKFRPSTEKLYCAIYNEKDAHLFQIGLLEER